MIYNVTQDQRGCLLCALRNGERSDAAQARMGWWVPYAIIALCDHGWVVTWCAVRFRFAGDTFRRHYPDEGGEFGGGARGDGSRQGCSSQSNYRRRKVRTSVHCRAGRVRPLSVCAEGGGNKQGGGRLFVDHNACAVLFFVFASV